MVWINCVYPCKVAAGFNLRGGSQAKACGYKKVMVRAGTTGQSKTMHIYYPNKLKYTKNHVWVKLKGNIATIGITQYMLKRLGTLIYLDLPQVGDELLAGIAFGEVESLNAISELTCPVAGTVIKDNKRLLENLDILSDDPYGEGWLIKVRVADLKQLNSLMTAEEYKKYTENGVK